MGDKLVMNSKERDRKAMFELVRNRHITLKEASVRLMLSYRQTKRQWRRYIESGDEGLLHRSRGKAPNSCKAEDFKRAVLNYYESKLSGFGPTFASEKLVAVNLPVDHETLRRWLIEASLWQHRPRKSPYRRRRERRARFGELVQMDGSFHDWFNTGDKHCLMNMVDDATGATQALLFDEETTEAAMRTLWRWIELYGVPLALYTDKRNVYVTDREPTLEEQLAGIKPLTVFGKACKKLGIEIITAHSPQAKGRVERSNGVYQDRFINELKFQNITTKDAANELLKNNFCQQLNDKFACTPKAQQNAHRALKKREKLAAIFCWETTRRLSNDWTIRYQNAYYQLEKEQRIVIKPKAILNLVTTLDKTLTISYKGKSLKWQKLEHKPSIANTQKAPASKQDSKRAKANSKHSPWRQYNPGWLNGKMAQKNV